MCTRKLTEMRYLSVLIRGKMTEIWRVFFGTQGFEYEFTGGVR